uniref:BolA-like protein n=1 Tax=Globisporangium ultimum (strain ATCC 200006 / CBS 805.95 / DAOM BR144) TaxID=431595 RepID=K3WXP7_GLOUD
MMLSVRTLARRSMAARVAGVSRFSSLDNGTEAENAMHAALAERLAAVHVKVTDVSGGCGSMFDIEVASPQFVGQTRVKQHRMVNEILKEEIKGMHGLTIRTMTPEQFASKP